jgi:hypothetical protein
LVACGTIDRASQVWLNPPDAAPFKAIVEYDPPGAGT